jgi:hypothetical protein
MSYIDVQGPKNGPDIDPAMSVESTIFCSQYGIYEILRDLIYGDKPALFPLGSEEPPDLLRLQFQDRHRLPGVQAYDGFYAIRRKPNPRRKALLLLPRHLKVMGKDL